MISRFWSPTAVRSRYAHFVRPAEMGIGTVAVYPYEDRNSLHRLKADESLSDRRHRTSRSRIPVGGPDRVDGLACGADAVIRDTDSLSENPIGGFIAAAGITFIGPSADVSELTGNKIPGDRGGTRSRLTGVGRPRAVLDCRGTATASEATDSVVRQGGGGGGVSRRVTEPAALPEDVELPAGEAIRFGDPTVFLERLWSTPPSR